MHPYKPNNGLLDTYFKMWYSKNRDKVRDRQTRPVKCLCGKTIQNHCLKKHKLSKYHLKRFIAK